MVGWKGVEVAAVGGWVVGTHRRGRDGGQGLVGVLGEESLCEDMPVDDRVTG